MSGRTRLSAAERRLQVLRAAEKLLLSQGYLPLPLDQLADQIGISKALVYTYFPSQHDLFNAALAARLQQLSHALKSAGAKLVNNRRSITAAAEVYFDHVAHAGPIIQFILRDNFMTGQVSHEIHAMRLRLTLPVVRGIARDLNMRPRQAVAAFHLLATIPEEAGAQVYRGQISLEEGRELCRDLVAAGLGGLRAKRR